MMNITEQIVDEIERLQDLRLDDRLTDDGYKKLQDYKTALKVVNDLTTSDVSFSEERAECVHPRQEREYIGRNTIKCKLCGHEFE